MKGIEERFSLKIAGPSGRWDKMSGVGASQMILALQVGLGDFKIMQGHVRDFCGRGVS